MIRINQSPNFGTGPILVPNGSLTAPSYSFLSDPDTGFFLQNQGLLAFSSAGVQVYEQDQNEWIGLRGTGTQSTPRIRFASGAVNVPTYAFQLDQDTGMWNSAADQVSIVAGGLEGVRVEDPADLVATETSIYVYDKDNNTVEQVTVGAADSGGVGFKVLRIPN